MNAYLVLILTILSCAAWGVSVRIAQMSKIYINQYTWLVNMLPNVAKLEYVQTAHATKAAIERANMNLEKDPTKLFAYGVIGVIGCAMFVGFVTGTVSLLPAASPTTKGDVFAITMVMVTLCTILTMAHHTYAKGRMVKLLRQLYAEQMFVV